MNTLDRVIKVANDHAILSDLNESPITSEMRFEEDLKMDSLDRVEFAMQLEEEFGINIPHDQGEQAKTIGQAVTMIDELLILKSVLTPWLPPADRKMTMSEQQLQADIDAANNGPIGGA